MYLQKNSNYRWTFAPNSGLYRKFRHGKSMVQSTKVIDGRTCRFHAPTTVERIEADWMHSLLHIGRCNALTTYYDLFLICCTTWSHTVVKQLSHLVARFAVAERLVANARTQKSSGMIMRPVYRQYRNSHKSCSDDDDHDDDCDACYCSCLPF